MQEGQQDSWCAITILQALGLLAPLVCLQGRFIPVQKGARRSTEGMTVPHPCQRKPKGS